MRQAYSYLRFSSPKQADGDSVRRQVQNREAWLKAHPGVQLDGSLVLEDRGRSAFRRQNWDTYALARFVEGVKSGRVDTGSYLLVEHLDRLSREDAGQATDLFLSIVNNGIVIVQLSPVVMEFARPVNVHSLMFAIVELSRGHSESAIKSERCREAWRRKSDRAGKAVVTRKLTGWIRCNHDGKLSLDPAAARTVRRAFALARDGHSTTTIAKTFNAERVPVIGRKVIKGRPVLWSAPTIYQILTSRTAVGEYLPYHWTRRADKPDGEPVLNYYPAVVDEHTFQAVRAVLATRNGVGRGRRGKYVNIFAGLRKDARDGGSLSYAHRGDACTLIPVNVQHGSGLSWSVFPAAPLERAILSKLKEVRAEDVQGGGGAARKVEDMSGEHAAAKQKVEWYQARCDAATTKEDFDLCAGKATEWERKRKELAARLASAQQEAASPLSEAWGEFKTLADLIAEDDSDELRVRVRTALRRAV